MDRFGFSLLPAAAEAGLDTITVSRHMPLFRREVARNDTTLLVAHCARPDRLLSGPLLLMLTDRHIVVTRSARMTSRARPHVSAALATLGDVRWQPMARMQAVDLYFRLRGEDHHLWVRADRPGRMDRLRAAFSQALGPRVPSQPTAPRMERPAREPVTVAEMYLAQP